MTQRVESMKWLGQFMRAVRQSNGWSLERASEKTGVPTVVIGSYERGDRNPSVPNLLRWVESMGYRLAVLGPNDVVASVSDDGSDVDWFVVYDGVSRIPCLGQAHAQSIQAHMPGARVAYRTHVYGDLTFEGEQ